jgi:energy-coupling factor transporter transmembrane protein EcfT
MLTLNVRSILLLVILITSVAVAYQSLVMQVSCLILTLFLLTILNTGTHKWQRLKKRMSHLTKILISIMVLQILFRQDGAVWWQWQFLKITQTGVEYGLITVFRLLLIILIAGMLFDISFYDFLIAFHKWKFPYELSFMIASVIHFITIFEKEFARTRETLFLRGIDIKKIPVLQRGKAFVTILFPILARAVSDIKFRAISLDLRAFRLHKSRTFYYDKKLKKADIFVHVLCGMIIFTFILKNII